MKKILIFDFFDFFSIFKSPASGKENVRLPDSSDFENLPESGRALSITDLKDLFDKYIGVLESQIQHKVHYKKLVSWKKLALSSIMLRKSFFMNQRSLTLIRFESLLKFVKSSKFWPMGAPPQKSFLVKTSCFFNFPNQICVFISINTRSDSYRYTGCLTLKLIF